MLMTSVKWAKLQPILPSRCNLSLWSAIDPLQPMQTTNYSILPDVVFWREITFTAARSCVRSDIFEYCKNDSDVFAATSTTPNIFTVSEHTKGSRVFHVLYLLLQGSYLLKYVTYQTLEHLTTMLAAVFVFGCLGQVHKAITRGLHIVVFY